MLRYYRGSNPSRKISEFPSWVYYQLAKPEPMLFLPLLLKQQIFRFSLHSAFLNSFLHYSASTFPSKMGVQLEENFPLCWSLFLACSCRELTKAVLPLDRFLGLCKWNFLHSYDLLKIPLEMIVCLPCV